MDRNSQIIANFEKNKKENEEKIQFYIEKYLKNRNNTI